MKTIKKIARSPYSLYITLLGIGILAYALQLNELGFYWDDWPWVWRAHVQGTAGMLKIDEYHRPLSGVVLYIGGLLAGENPLGWQLYALTFRILGAAALAWMLNILWENEKNRNTAIALFFLLYPGFNQQFVSVNNSRHLFPLITFFLSFGFMLKSLQNGKNARQQTAIALALNLITMLTSEYYYGLELTRPLLIWLHIRRNEKDLRQSLLQAFKSWLPYALLLGTLFGWRYYISTLRNYSITVFDEVGTGGSNQLIGKVALDLWTATVGAWSSIFNWTTLNEYGRSTKLIYAAVTALSMSGILLYFGLQEKDDNHKTTSEALIFGGSALVISLLPFWLTGLDPKLGFPSDRLLLPAALGVSILLGLLIDLLLKPHLLKISMLAILIGFAVGSHYQNALIYRSAWASTSSFFHQLSTRAPSLPAQTTILSNQLPGRSTDNSLIAPMNWMYAPNFTDGNIPVIFMYVDLRFGRDHTVIDETQILSNFYLAYPFEGDTAKVLGVFYEPPACLQLVDAENGLRQIPAPMDAALPYSNPAIIFADDALPATLPSFFAPEDDALTWCDYFQQAALARQRGDWATAAALGDAAFGAGKSANHPSELIPFIEGYARSGSWQKAAEITLAAPKRNSMFCGVWETLQMETSAAAEKDAALEQVRERFECDF